MKALLHTALKILAMIVIALVFIFLLAWLASVGLLSAKIAFALMFSTPFWFCLVKLLYCLWLMHHGLPATGYLSFQTRLSHLRYVSADGIERKGACNLLTRHALKAGRRISIWYDPNHPERFTAGIQEIVVQLFFCILFAGIPIFLLIKL